MIVSIVVAVSRNGVIGRGGALPWLLSDELRHFKDITMGKPIIMGRKTYQSIGKPLPGRMNIVVTRDAAFHAPGCTIVHSLDGALAAADDAPEAMIIGGASLYAEALPCANRMYLTRVLADVEGDVYFPEVDWKEWQEIAQENFSANEKNEFPFEIVTLERQ